MANMANMRIRTRRPDPFTTGEGHEWILWRENYEAIVILNQWNNDQHLERSKNECLVSITGEAKRRIQGIASAGAGETLAQFLDRIQLRYLPPAASQFAKSEYDACVQLPDEEIITYHSRLRVVYVRAHPALAGALEQSTMLIRKFTLGLANTAIKTYVLDHNPQTFAAALEHAQNKAATEATVAGAVVPGGKVLAMDINAVYDGTETPSTSEANRRLRRMGPDANVGAAGPGPAPVCWNCGRSGHLARSCQEGAAVGAVRRGRGQARGRGVRGGRAQGRRRGRGSASAGRGRRRGINNIGDSEEGNDEYQDIVTELARDINNEYCEEEEAEN